LAGHLLEQGGYEQLKIPMEFNPERTKVTSLAWTDPRREHGELLCPVRFTHEAVADFKVRLGNYGYAGQFDQEPVPSGGAIFSRERFRYFWVRPLDFASVEVAAREWYPARWAGVPARPLCAPTA
jgi:hypothetical protein